MSEIPPRSPHLLSADNCVLLVVDLQERLLPTIRFADRIEKNASVLIQAASRLSIPTLVSEQYPEKLGTTVPSLASLLPHRDSKRMFSCRELFPKWEAVWGDTRRHAILIGIESHVCILQTAFDLLSLGWSVSLPIDALGSQKQIDHDTAIQRLTSEGAILTTTDGVLLEWIETSTHPEFKTISQWIKEKVANDAR